MYRIGFGYDSHRFDSERPLVLGGVRIADSSGLRGHSDADAVLHALTDAILGAVAAGDIGELFPDADPQWAGAASSQFVTAAVKIAAENGYGISNCDITIIAEQPKLAPYKDAMRRNIADLLGLDASGVSIKAKTNETMGFVGRGEGLVAMAVVMMTEN